MINRYKKKPVIIEAIQWNGNSNKQEVEEFVGKPLRCEVYSDTAYEAGVGAPLFSLYIETLEGPMRADPRDYIIKGVLGEFYPCKPDAFFNTYDEVEDE